MVRRAVSVLALVASLAILATLCRSERVEVVPPPGASPSSPAETQRTQAAPVEALVRERIEVENVAPRKLVELPAPAGRPEALFGPQSRSETAAVETLFSVIGGIL